MKTILIFLILFSASFTKADADLEEDFKRSLKKCEWVSDNPLNVLLDSKTKIIKGRELLFTIWTHGAPGETLRIFDPNQKSRCLLFEQTSGYDISYEILKEGNIKVIFSQETSIEDPTPVEHTFIFRPKSR